MATITDTILQQVTEQVKNTIEAVSSMGPLPAFDYVSTMGCESSHRHTPAESLRRSDEVRETARPERDGRSYERNHGRSTGGNVQQVIQAHQARQGAQERLANSATASTPYATHSRKPQFMTSTLKPHNARNYCEFHEQNGHNTAECRELKKALHKIADEGQIDHFLKRGP
ncbi:hypothetical protein Cgig2_019187 [Carnegiea gigantea]|uniref:Reverse transcriptase domain-containing protein n=1 Tax=Carnegiea gigantea TaxID=171969 RepID=A0A9Q1K3I6_9CARY|nr:hypothetical protein Cgig2_019187 [Carnegiea gigantea]